MSLIYLNLFIAERWTSTGKVLKQLKVGH